MSNQMSREQAALNMLHLLNMDEGRAWNNKHFTPCEKQSIEMAIAAMHGPQRDPITGLVPCGRGEWIYTIEKGSCMDYHVTAKCSECGWDWFSKDGVGNFSAVFSAFITNGDSKRDEAERFLIENAKANNKLNYCPNCGAKMEDKP